MRPQNFYAPVKIFSYIVLALMVASAGYACVMTIVHWSGINV